MSMRKFYTKAHKGNGKPVLIDGARTGFVKAFGAFQKSDVLELFSRVVDGLIRKSGIDPFEINEISAGVVAPQSKNGNVARDAIINLGLPNHIHGYTVNRACTSSLQSIAEAQRSIISGNPHVIIAGGAECISDVPIVFSRKAREFLASLNFAKSPTDKLKLLKTFNLKSWLPEQPAIKEPLTGFTMGEHAEMMAKENEISREEQDRFALASHLNAAKAQKSGYFLEEILPIWVSPKFGECVEADNMVRETTSLEKLSTLKPAFDKKYGTLTAGNSSALTDGASAVIIADEGRAIELGLKPKTRIVDTVFVGIDPNDQLLIGPAVAIPLLLKRNGLTIENIDLFEIHEAFAAQVLSCVKAMGSAAFCEKNFGDSKAFGEIPGEKLNVNGGAIAIGHPFGATGARLVMTQANELKRRKAQYGVVAICAAGGMAGAMLLENIID